MTLHTYYRDVILQDAPIAYYPGDDSSGAPADLVAGHNGFVVGSLAYGQAALVSTDVSRPSLGFDGSTAYVKLPNAVQFQPPIAYDAWVYPTTSLGSGEGVYIVAADPGLRLRIQPDGSLAGLVNIAGNWYSTNTNAGVISLGTLHHVAVRCDASNNLFLYLDGQLVASTATAAGSIGYINQTIIGADYFGGPGKFFHGRIGHVALYRNLTPDRILAHALAGGTFGASVYHAFVGGVEANIQAGSLHVDNQIGQRSTGGLTVYGPLGVVYEYGTLLRIYDTAGAIAFAGYTSKDKKKKQPGARQGTGFLYHDLQVMDNCYRADKRRVFKTYLMTTAGAIVTDLVSSYLAAEGVTIASSVATGPLINEVIWNGSKSVSDALAWLANLAGFWWNIDVNGVLFFQPYGGINAPFSIDGTQVDSVKDLTVEDGNDMYVNTEYAKGAYAEKGTTASPLVETFHGNSLTRSFTLSYEVASVISVTLNGAGQTVGSKGIDSGKQFYSAVGDGVIAQDPGGALLGSGDSLVVTYKGRYPVLAVASNPTLIAAQKTREGGGSGIVESVYTNTKVRTISAAYQAASALLAHYGADTTILKFATPAAHSTGLQPGQLLPVSLPDFGLNAKNMLISGVSISDQVDGYNIWNVVQAVGSPVESAQWQTYWSNLMAQSSDPSDYTDTSDTSLALLFSSSVTTTWHGTTTFAKTTCPICNTSTFCGTGVIVC